MILLGVNLNFCKNLSFSPSLLVLLTNFKYARYDSNKLKNKIKNSKFVFLLTLKNKRNTKNKNKLNALKLSPEEKELMKKRIKVEHTNAQLKQYKRILFRYDKYSSHYLTFIHLDCLDILIKMIKKK